MPTLDDLPSETRCLIYEHLFAGQSLKYYPPVFHRTRSETLKIRARPVLLITSILYVCRRSLREARPALLKTATIHLKSPRIPRHLWPTPVGDAEFLSTISHVRISVPTPGPRVLKYAPRQMVVHFMNLMPNLKTVTLDVELDLKLVCNPRVPIQWDVRLLRRSINEATFTQILVQEPLAYVRALTDEVRREIASGHSVHQFHDRSYRHAVAHLVHNA